MNTVLLIGNLTRDPNIGKTSTGTSVCHFAIAVNRPYSGSDDVTKTDFFNVTAWGELGKTAFKHLKKGNKVAVSGSIELNNYEDSQGVKRTGVDVVARSVDFFRTSKEKDLTNF